MVGRKFWARFKFSPLRYNDGTPCYFRASCLAGLALCLMVQGFLGGASDHEAAGAMQLAHNASAESSTSGTILPNTLQGSQTVTATAVGATTMASAVSSSPLAVAPVHTINPISDPGAGTPAPLSAPGLSSTTKVAAPASAAPVPAVASAGATAEPLDVTLQPDGSIWSFFGITSDEDKRKAQLLKNRKAALVELMDSADYFNSCGTINSSFSKCNYRFSNKIKSNYDVAVTAAVEGYQIAITAKGAQAQDPCAQFMVNSKGEYFAFDQQGYQNLKCFVNTEVPKQIMAISQALELINDARSDSSALAARP